MLIFSSLEILWFVGAFPWRDLASYNWFAFQGVLIPLLQQLVFLLHNRGPLSVVSRRLRRLSFKDTLAPMRYFRFRISLSPGGAGTSRLESIWGIAVALWRRLIVVNVIIEHPLLLE